MPSNQKKNQEIRSHTEAQSPQRKTADLNSASSAPPRETSSSTAKSRMREVIMSHRPHQASNLEALDKFWRRTPFHDLLIEEVSALNKRVVIRLSGYTLVVTSAAGLKRCELPSVWLYETVTPSPGGFQIDVETESGHLIVTGADVRLIRNDDLAMLIPPIDS